MTGFALGAGLMYVFDPLRGPFRRARFRDKILKGLHRTEHAVGKTGRDVRNRVTGMVADLRSAWRREPVDDDVLAERVRAKMGRTISHPSAVHVAVEDGVAILSGPILADEVDTLVRCVAHVRGIEDVESNLDIHQEADVQLLREGGHVRSVARRTLKPSERLGVGLASAAVLAGLLRSRSRITQDRRPH